MHSATRLAALVVGLHVGSATPAQAASFHTVPPHVSPSVCGGQLADLSDDGRVAIGRTSPCVTTLPSRMFRWSIGAAVELRSTAFARMDGLEFRQYVNAAIEIIFNDYLPGVRRQNVFAEVEAMVGPRPW